MREKNQAVAWYLHYDLIQVKFKTTYNDIIYHYVWPNDKWTERTYIKWIVMAVWRDASGMINQGDIFFSSTITTRATMKVLQENTT